MKKKAEKELKPHRICGLRKKGMEGFGGYTSKERAEQIVHPYYFGDSARKKTCWWLKNLPPLVPDNMVDEGESFYWGDGNKRQPQWYREAWNLSPKERAKARSKTFPGMARAIAEQWGNLLLNGDE